MFRSLQFSRFGLHLVAHVRHNSAQTDAHMWVCTKGRGETLSTQLPLREQKGFCDCLEKVASSEVELFEEFSGDVAVTLTRFLIELAWVESYQHLPAGPELLGFWEPSQEREPGCGIFMWYNGAYYCDVVDSRREALLTFDTFSWLVGERAERLRKRIASWNIKEQTAGEIRYLQGPVAELFAKASVFQKYKGALHASAQ